MERKTITFKFEGDLEGVSVGTFTAALLGYSRAVQASARELDSNAVIDVEITATRPGCLEAILQAVVKDLPGILGTLSQTSDQLEPVLSAFKGYLELRRFLGKNGAPKSVERVGDGISVTAGNNSVINITQNVYKVSGSNEVDSAVSSMFGALADNEKIGGLSISGDGVDGFESSRDDFEDIRTAPKCETEQERDVIMKGQHLNVAKPVLEYSDKRKWELYWNGQKLSANMGDFDFLGQLARRERTFGIGDDMIADLLLRQRRNEIGAWENKSVRITKVHDLRPAPEDQKLL